MHDIYFFSASSSGSRKVFGMIFLFLALSFAQWGPDSRTICHQNVDRLEQILNLSSDCHWVADSSLPTSAPDLPPPPTFYNSRTGQCQGTFECTSPFPERDRTYRVLNAFCRVTVPPPGNVCYAMGVDCKNSFISIERNQCDSVPLSTP